MVAVEPMFEAIATAGAGHDKRQQSRHHSQQHHDQDGDRAEPDSAPRLRRRHGRWGNLGWPDYPTGTEGFVGHAPVNGTAVDQFE